MSDVEYNEELRWRLEVLKNLIEEGKMQFSREVAEDVRTSLSAIKYAEDGRIDLTTVDGRTRAMAMAAATAHHRNSVKDSGSIEEISNLYFEYVEQNLGWIAKQAEESGFDANTFANMASSSEEFVASVNPGIDDFLSGFEEFWKTAAEAINFHVQDLQCTKAVFGGDLFPAHNKNVASSVGLYVDTIVLSDPFWRSRQVFERSSPETRVYYLVKHAVSLLQYRDLVLAEVNKPIVVIVPGRVETDDHEAEFLSRVSTEDAVSHAEVLFGRKFSDFEDLMDFVGDLETPESVIKQFVDGNRLLFDTEAKGSIQEQLQDSLKGPEAKMMASRHAGEFVAKYSLGRMMQATDILLQSRYLSGTPLMDAPTSWQYFNWKLEYNSDLAEDQQTHLHMVRGLQRVSETDMHWLGEIPPAALIEMRQQGAFDEVRDMLSAGIREIAEAKPGAFFHSSDQIVENIQDAFAKHQENIKELRSKKWRFAGHDIGSWIATGAIELAAIATGTPAFGVGAFAVNQVVDAPKLKEIPERFRNLRDAHVELKKSPMGLFFSHKR